MTILKGPSRLKVYNNDRRRFMLHNNDPLCMHHKADSSPYLKGSMLVKKCVCAWG